MPEPILCHVCGHDIDEHREGNCCLGCMTFVPDDFCSLKPSDIARALVAHMQVRPAAWEVRHGRD